MRARSAPESVAQARTRAAGNQRRPEGASSAAGAGAVRNLCCPRRAAAGCLRKDNRATAIVTAAASTASPMTCPPMSRTVSGQARGKVDRLRRVLAVLRRRPCRSDGDGDTCGNAEPRSPLGWTPRPGGWWFRWAALPRAAASRRRPRSGVGDELGFGEFFGLMSTVADAVAEFDACDELAVAVSVTCLVGRSGAASSACTSTLLPGVEAAHGALGLARWHADGERGADAARLRREGDLGGTAGAAGEPDPDRIRRRSCSDPRR